MKGWSHRARLTVTMTGIAGVLFGATFAIMVYGVRLQKLSEVENIVEPAARLIVNAIEQQPEIDLSSVNFAYPGLSVAVFGRDGIRVAGVGAASLWPTRINGVQEVDGTLLYVRSLAADGDGRSDSYLVVAAVDWQRRQNDVRRVGILLGLTWVALVALIAGATYLAAQATFRPLEEMTRQARTLSETDLSRRLESNDFAEFQVFANELNQFLDKLQAAMQREERFAADAAHELRTPLTALLGHMETTLLRDRSTDEYRRALQTAVAEAERIAHLVEMLLKTARLEVVPTKPIDLAAEVGRTTVRWSDLFAEAGVVLDVDAKPSSVALRPEEFAVILDNLLSNALRFSPSGGTCRVRLVEDHGWAVLQVADEGPGVPEADRERIFGRFVRLDHARNRAEGGFGIGLSLVHRVVTNRGGSVEVVPNRPKGSLFIVRLPAVAPATRTQTVESETAAVPFASGVDAGDGRASAAG